SAVLVRGAAAATDVEGHVPPPRPDPHQQGLALPAPRPRRELLQLQRVLQHHTPLTGARTPSLRDGRRSPPPPRSRRGRTRRRVRCAARSPCAGRANPAVSGSPGRWTAPAARETPRGW